MPVPAITPSRGGSGTASEKITSSNWSPSNPVADCSVSNLWWRGIDPADGTKVTITSLTTEEFASTVDVLRLEMVLDPVTRTVSGTYVINSGSARPIVEGGSTQLTVPASFFAGTDHDGATGTARLSYAGIFGSHRTAATADAIDFAFDNFAIGEVASSGVPRITAVLPRDGAVGVSPSTSVSANELFLPNGRNGVFGVDNSSITPQTVRLYKLPANVEVPATVNGTGGGDAINLTPPLPPGGQHDLPIRSGRGQGPDRGSLC